MYQKESEEIKVKNNEMNIYEEAIENLRSVMAKFIIPSVEDSDYGCLYDLCHFYNTLDKEENEWLRRVYKALERAKKVEDLLDLYHLKDMHLDDYYTYGSLRGSQKALDNLRSVRDEIEVLEKELEELK